MSRIDCGRLSRAGKDGIEFRGDVQLGDRLDGALTLRKHDRAGSSAGHPDYTVEYTPTSGRPRRVGAAWGKTTEAGGLFFSITIDDPDWPNTIYLTAFPIANEPGSYVLVWSRPRGERAQDTNSTD